uniref:NADH-ubiquinone oxidoreductase chain 2 n=1 Tax=Staphylinidae sp. BMNH 1274642 TaxID=1796583 RepID=A0A126TE77_9COLE|nr:NADH dehydrogenase subunit 2 [Staphylinidae sp. BMNH 1274642]
MKFYKIMFFISLSIGTLISISSSTWMGMWMGLEINLLSIIPLMNSSKNLYSTEASLKYFITQALASTILLFSTITLLNNISYLFNINNNITLMFNSALFMKMGAAPFHFWFPEIIDGLSWMNCLIILSWQKIAPMIILMYNINFPLYFSIIILFSMMISGIMGLNQVSMRKILAYSSINHIGWMIGSMLFMETIWLMYFLIYTLISINIITIFNLINVFYFKQLCMSMKSNLQIKFFFILNFLSLGGLPPFLGFLPKWLTIENLIKQEAFFLIFIMICLTLLVLYFYIRMIYSSLTMNTTEIKYFFNMKTKEYWVFFSNFISIIALTLSTLIFNFI